MKVNIWLIQTSNRSHYSAIYHAFARPKKSTRAKLSGWAAAVLPAVFPLLSVLDTDLLRK